MAPSDEFDAYNFQEFTAADFAAVDSEILEMESNRGGPSVTIEVEKSAAVSQLTRALPSNDPGWLPTRRGQESPFQRHRWWTNVFSVTDLVSPAWYVATNLFISQRC